MFYLLRLNFDQGGFASFILLAGITVNAAIYILNEYNSLQAGYPQMAPLKTYLRAFPRQDSSHTADCHVDHPRIHTFYNRRELKNLSGFRLP